MTAREITLPIRCSTYKMLLKQFSIVMLAEIFIMGLGFIWMLVYTRGAINSVFYATSFGWFDFVLFIVIMATGFYTTVSAIVGITFGLVEIYSRIPTFKCIPDEVKEE